MDDRQCAGFTLPELLVTLTIVGVLAGVAAPAMLHVIQSTRLHAAAEAVAGDLRLARELTLHTGVPHVVRFVRESPMRWCYVMGIDVDASCGTAPAAGARAAVSDDFPGIQLLQANFAGASSVTFDTPRGTARAGRVSLGDSRAQVSIMLSMLGRTRLCSDDGRYPPC